MSHRDSAGSVETTHVACTNAPTTSDEALRLAIKLAVDAGDYERATALLDVAKRTPKAATVTPLVVVRERDKNG